MFFPEYIYTFKHGFKYSIYFDKLIVIWGKKDTKCNVRKYKKKIIFSLNVYIPFQNLKRKDKK